MKYIRTKDRLYKLSNNTLMIGDLLNTKTNECKENVAYYFVERTKLDEKSSAIIEANDVLKMSDSIEELCDDFVVCRSYFRDTDGFIDFDPAKDAKQYAEKHNERCFGAIWTDKGMIYVAEYKDGKWELL